jgi:hypothetical protein
MFSLLDRLLGLPMKEVLDTIQLPDEVVRALLTRGGVYGPYLALAEACELNSNLVASMAASLDISPLDVNKAHLSALAWAQAQVGRRIDAEFLRLRIQVFFGRREQHVHAFLFQLVDVGLEGARILVEILVRAELQAVDEDRGDHRVAVLARQAHQRQVALVQIAHGRDEGGA